MRSLRTTSATLSLTLLLCGALVAPAWSQDGERSVADLATEARRLLTEGRAEDAIEIYRQALDRAPEEPDLWVELGEAYRSAMLMPDAIAAFRYTIELSPNHELAQLALAESFRQLANFEEAQRLLEAAAQTHPESAAPPFALGRIFTELQLYDDAAEALLTASRLDPDNIAVRIFLASTYRARNELDAAIRELDRVIAQERDHALAHHLRGSI